MAASYKAHCLVLKKTKLGETDLIITMLSDEGQQIRGVAKGARKPGNKRFGARLEPFSEVEVVLYPGRSLESITEVKALRPNAGCREDLDASSAASILAELLEKSTRDGEVEPRAFMCAAKAFELISGNGPDKALLLSLAAVFKIIAMMGIRPALRECAACGVPLEEVEAFDLYAGGCLCDACAGDGGDVTLYAPLVPWLEALLGSTFAELLDIETAPCMELLGFMDAWIREHLGLQLKTIGFARCQM